MHCQLLPNVLIFTLAIAISIAILFLPKAFAQDVTADITPPAVDILPASSVPDMYNQTHPPIRLTPDKSELIRLDTDAATIIVGNPSHVSVLAESTKTLVLVPQIPGATHFTVLDKDGNLVMQRHVIVASPQEKYIRIRSTCRASEDKNCQETQIYYCPDMCHNVALATKAPDTRGGANAQSLTQEEISGTNAVYKPDTVSKTP